MGEEALTLALENHFVTPVTSLVVVRPDEEDTLADVDDPTPDYDYPVMYSLSYAAPAPQPQVHKYISSGSRQAYSPQSFIEPVIADSYDLAYDDTGSGFESFSYDIYYYDDYSASTSTSTSNIVARTSTTTTFTSSTTTTTSQPKTCQLTLFSKTYNRGEELVLLDGPCCWQLFGEVNFAGSSAWLRPGGNYKGTDSFGRDLFQEVSSLKRVQC